MFWDSSGVCSASDVRLNAFIFASIKYQLLLVTLFIFQWGLRHAHRLMVSKNISSERRDNSELRQAIINFTALITEQKTLRSEQATL